jgi:hypothetical protein
MIDRDVSARIADYLSYLFDVMDDLPEIDPGMGFLG